MYEPAHAMRTDAARSLPRSAELDGKDTDARAEAGEIMNDVAVPKVTTNLFGERWSKLTVNCMANPLAGLGPRHRRGTPPSASRAHRDLRGRRGREVGRAWRFEVEPIYGIAAQRSWTLRGRGLTEVEADVAAEAPRPRRRAALALQDVMRGRRTEIDYLTA